MLLINWDMDRWNIADNILRGSLGNASQKYDIKPSIYFAQLKYYPESTDFYTRIVHKIRNSPDDV